MRVMADALKPRAIAAFDWAMIKARVVGPLALVVLGLECIARLILAGVWIAGALLVLGFWALCLGAFIVLLTRAQ